MSLRRGPVIPSWPARARGRECFAYRRAPSVLCHADDGSEGGAGARMQRVRLLGSPPPPSPAGPLRWPQANALEPQGPVQMSVMMLQSAGSRCVGDAGRCE